MPSFARSHRQEDASWHDGQWAGTHNTGNGFNPSSPKFKTLILLTDSHIVFLNISSENVVVHVGQSSTT